MRRHPDTLTARESEVLDLIRRGLTNEEIAEGLDISLDGAKYHVSQILSKLGVATREEAAAWRPQAKRAGYWKWALVGGIGAMCAIAASALVFAIAGDERDIDSEAGVIVQNRPTTNGTTPKETPSNASPAGTPRPPEMASAASPNPSPRAIPAAVAPQLYVDPEPPAEPESSPSPEATPTPAPFDTPSPTDCACSGILGTATRSPTCPWGCAPAPTQATIGIWNADRTTKLLEVTTDQQGHFRVPLAEGRYYIDPQGPAEPLFVTVPAIGFVSVSIDSDTGLR